MTRNEHQIRRTMLLNLYPRMTARGKASIESFNQRLHMENAAARIHRRKHLAARLGAYLGALFLAAAILSFCYTIHSPLRILVYIAGLAWGAWGYHFNLTRH